MNVDEMYRLVQYICNKNQQGYISPTQFNLIIGQGQTSFLDYLLGEFQQYQYKQNQPRIAYSQNETIRNRLTPLIYGYNLTFDNTGFAPYMGDYQQVDTMWSSIYGGIYGYNRIRYAPQNKLYSYTQSRIDPVPTNPIYWLEDEGFRVLPTTLSQARVSYVRTPPPIYWAYTLDGNNRPVYDPVNSIQPVWYETDILEIISRALRMVGVNLQSSVISQYAEEIKNGGQ